MAKVQTPLLKLASENEYEIVSRRGIRGFICNQSIIMTATVPGHTQHTTTLCPRLRVFRFRPKLEKFKPVITCSSVIDNNLIEFPVEGLATLQLASDKQRREIGLRFWQILDIIALKFASRGQRESQFVR
ncbi:hypothetical protein CDAR_611171 [Caerostris darwini]|uniref:Ribosomal protein S10 n=1 Tax=Caerostris darwini TaxID=1538125 RepID=A0AAV4TCK8_9ARAC|nr:hypothetical protein CDAR_611171 [Caerostris darwini]